MEENRQDTPPGMPGVMNPVAHTWMRLSPRLVPFLAVITAFLFGIPLMIITGGDGNVGKGLDVSGVAYTALVEGAIGVTINDVADDSDFDLIIQWAENNDIESSRLSRQARPFEKVGEIGMDRVGDFGLFLADYPDLDAEIIDELAERIPDMQDLGEDAIREIGQILTLLDEAGLSRGDVGDFAALMAEKDDPTAADWDEAFAQWPELESIKSEQLTAMSPHYDAIVEHEAAVLSNPQLIESWGLAWIATKPTR